MKIAYIGTPVISAGLLNKLIDQANDLGIEIVDVITQPDSPLGRKQVLTPSAVKALALQNGLSVSHDLSVLTGKTIDLALLFAFGKIIPQEVLDIPTHGIWNIHPSLLPAYRGASPITYPLFLGDKASGVTLMQMDSDLDHGPVISQVHFDINEADKRGDIEDQVITIAYGQVKEALLHLVKNNCVNVAQQDHSLATFTRPLKKDDGYVELSIVLKAIQGEHINSDELPSIISEYHVTNKLAFGSKTYSASYVLHNMIRAFHGWPGVWTYITTNNVQKRLKFIEASVLNGVFTPITVQLEGKNPVDFSTFTAAYSLE